MHENICWFCRKNVPQEKYLIHKNMYNPKSRRGGSFGQRLVYDVIKINIPRCKKCAGIQKRVNFFAAMYLILLFIIPIFAGFLGYRLEIKYDILDLSIYVGIGAFVIGLLMLVPYIKWVKPKIGGGIPIWSQLPEIQDWITKGWVIGNPPPA